MDYSKLITRSFDIVKKRRYLWWLGLLAALTEGGYGRMSQFDFGNYLNSDNLKNGGDAANSGGSVLGAATSFIGTNGGAIAIITLITIIIFILILFVSYSSKAGLIKSVDRIEENQEEWHFIDAFRVGRKYFLRLFGFSLLCFLSIVILLGVFAAPITFFFLAHQTSLTILAVALIIIGLLLLIALAIYIGMTFPVVERNIVLEEKGVFLAIGDSYRLLKQKFVKLFLTYLVNVGIGMAYSIVIGIASLIVAGLLFGIGYLLYLASHILAIAYGVISGIALMAALLGLAGFFTAYLSSYWTLAYRELKQG